MSISLSRYVDITSGIGAGTNVSTRSLSGLVVTGNPLVPSGRFLTLTSAAAVGTYFGTSSEEYARSVFYFGWVSKNTTAPRALNFWFWNDDAATASLIFGKPATYSLSTFTAISAGQLSLTLGGFTHPVTGVDMSGDASLAAVAATLQTAIRAYSAGGAAWPAATVSYDAARGCFDLVSGSTGADVVSVAAAPSNDVAAPLGWLTGAIYSNGTAAQAVADNLIALNAANNDFGSFCFTTALAPTLNTIEAAANWNNSLNPNIQFMFSWSVTAADAAAWSAALIGIGGNTGTLSPLADEYPEMAPMMILAATDYTRPNSVQNYMFQIFDLTPSVVSDADANTYDALRLNYYGQTQTAGQLLAFYQRGVMWFKDAAAASIMTVMLSLARIPANAQGRSQVLAILQGVINQALTNGTVSVGKPLTITQQLYITNATDDPTAWKQVQNVGYWVDAVIQPYVVDGITEFKIVYTFIYSKDDVVRLVEGTDILI